MDLRVTQHKLVTSPTCNWGPPPPCKLALTNLRLTMHQVIGSNAVDNSDFTLSHACDNMLINSFSHLFHQA